MTGGERVPWVGKNGGNFLETWTDGSPAFADLGNP